jgi:hypothetical protein
MPCLWNLPRLLPGACWPRSRAVMTNPPDDAEYNPLDYANLTLNCVRELMSRSPYILPPGRTFHGAGVYALFHTGALPIYVPIRSPDASRPIYVGKAVPPGARTGRLSATARPSQALHGRLQQHGHPSRPPRTCAVRIFSAATSWLRRCGSPWPSAS